MGGNMPGRRLRAALAGGLGLVTVGTVLVVAPLAQADSYDSTLLKKYATVDTGTCKQLSGVLTVTVDPDTGDCVLADSADGTVFKKDSGGIALKIELYTSANSMVAKMEFHPNGEKLWVYDTKNDGDGISVEPFIITTEGKWVSFGRGRGSAVGTDAVIDHRVVDLNEPEGQDLGFRVYNKAGDILIEMAARA